jgi:hypothetical protein
MGSVSPTNINGQRSQRAGPLMERSTRDRGLEVMGACYASVAGTAVLLQKAIVVPPTAAEGAYNTTPYDGNGGRGWCIFEQGVSMTVAAHLRAAEQQAEARQVVLPLRLVRAQERRAKVIDINAGAPDSNVRLGELSPQEVLEDVGRMITTARFTGKADRAVVQQMLAEFEWAMHHALTRALDDHARSGATVGGDLLSKARRPRSVSVNPSSALLTNQHTAPNEKEAPADDTQLARAGVELMERI